MLLVIQQDVFLKLMSNIYYCLSVRLYQLTIMLSITMHIDKDVAL